MLQTTLLLMKSLNKTETPIFPSVMCTLFPKATFFLLNIIYEVILIVDMKVLMRETLNLLLSIQFILKINNIFPPKTDHTQNSALYRPRQSKKCLRTCADTKI